jgi:hypothetical protein
MAVLTGGASTAVTAAGKGAQVGVKMADGTVKVITATTRLGGLALRAVNLLQNSALDTFCPALCGWPLVLVAV